MFYFSRKLRLNIGKKSGYLVHCPMYFWRRRRDFFRFYVTKPAKSVNSRDWTGLLIQGINPDHFILWHPSMIAGAESTIAGAELSIGGTEGHPKSTYTN